MSQKIVLIGDPAVGKTTLRKNFMGEHQTSDYIMTLGADFAKKDVQITASDTKGVVEVMIWDLAGQNEFSMVRQPFYQSASGGILVFDSLRKESFEHARRWIQDLWRNNGSGPCPVVFLANKEDLRETQTDAPSLEVIGELVNQIKGWALEQAQFNYPFYVTSALKGHNVDVAFDSLLVEIFDLLLTQH